MNKKVVKILDVTDIENLQSEIISYRDDNDNPPWDDIEVHIYSDGSYKILHHIPDGAL